MQISNFYHEAQEFYLLPHHFLQENILSVNTFTIQQTILT